MDSNHEVSDDVRTWDVCSCVAGQRSKRLPEREWIRTTDLHGATVALYRLSYLLDFW